MVLSVLSTFALVLFSRRGAKTLEVLLSCCVMISNVGYFILSCSRSMGEAVLANALTYIGGLFLPLLIVYILIDYSDSKVPIWFTSVIMLINVLVFISTLITDRLPYFYSALKFIPGDPARLIKEPGPVYYVKFILLAVEAALVAFFTILTYLGRRNASFRIMMIYAGSLAGAVVIYLAKKIFDLEIELLPFFYLICSILLDYVVTRTTIYDVNLSVQEKIDELSSYGYLVFDRKFRYVGSNAAAEKFFPEIKDARIDSKIIAKDYNFKGLLKWVVETAATAASNKKTKGKFKKSLTIDSHNLSEKKYLECEMSFIHFGNENHVTGYLVEIIDDTEQHNLNESIQHRNTTLAREAQKSQKEVEQLTKIAKSMQMSTILGMATLIESRDNSTGGHINRTSACVAVFVNHLKNLADYNMSEGYWDAVINAAPLHDLGKIMIPDNILTKDDILSDEEYQIMRDHAANGAKKIAQILEDVDDKEFVRVAINIAHYHHEKYNGKGYPDGLRGENIPFEARIMALADVFDAVVSRRYYKKALSYEEAFDLIDEEKGQHFDPHLARIFISIKREIIDLYESFESTEYGRNREPMMNDKDAFN